MGDVRWLGRLVLSVLRGLVWTAATVGLGVVTLWRGARTVRRLWRGRPEVFLCPRGHENPGFGAWECRSAPPPHHFEGWVFSPCPVCGLSAGWTPCRVCSLPILNPDRKK